MKLNMKMVWAFLAVALMLSGIILIGVSLAESNDFVPMKSMTGAGNETNWSAYAFDSDGRIRAQLFLGIALSVGAIIPALLGILFKGSHVNKM